jgi:hypothetical protein
MATDAPTKTRTSIAIRQAAGEATSTRAKDGCQDCNKRGLAILPVVPGVAPSSLKDRAPSVKQLDAWFDSADLKEHWYFLRALQPGYVYVFKPSRAWEAYVVDAAGLLRMVPIAHQPSSPADQTSMSEACKRNGDNLPAQVIAVDPEQHPEVWIAYSRYRWTPAVLDRYASNQTERDLRMTRVDVKAAASGQLGKGQAVPFGTPMGAHIGSIVADYASPATRALFDKELSQPLHSRDLQCESLARTMAGVSKETPAKTGAVIVLSDTVGVVAELNTRRNRIAADAAATAGMGDPEKARRRVVADTIEGIRLNAVANPGPWWDKNYGPERFLKHIKRSEWEAAKAESQQFKQLMSLIDRVSEDFVSVKESTSWRTIQRLDFDELDAHSASDHGHMVAVSIAGSGQTKVEREKIWYAVLQATTDAPDNWLDRALGALYKDLISYLAVDKKEDKAYDTVKGAAAISKELTSTGVEELSKFHSAIRIKRAANEATAALIETTGALMYRLRTEQPAAHYKLMRKVAVALLVRDGQVAQPKIVRGPFEKIIHWIQEVAFGPTRVGLAPAKVRGDLTNYDAYASTKGNFGDRGWRMSQSMDGALVLDVPSTKAKNGEVVAWVVTRLREGATLDTKTLSRLGLQDIDLTRPLPTGTVNPFLEAHLKRVGGRVDVMLGAGVLFFQANSFGNALVDFKTKNSTLDKVGGGLGMLTAVMSASSAGLETLVAVRMLRQVDKSALIAPQIWAARLSLAAGVLEGGYLVYKGVAKRAGGDTDSGYWTIGSGIAVVAASFAGYGAGAAVAAGMAGGAASFTALGISMGPIGWGLLALALIGAVIYFSWQAWATDDENLLPVEYWLDNGVFGNRQFVSGEVAANSPYFNESTKQVPPFGTVDEEMLALQRVLLVAQGRISGARDSGGSAIISYYEVSIPRYVQGSRLEIKFVAIKDGKRTDGGGILCEDGRTKPVRADISSRFTGMREGPELKIDTESGVLLVKGWFATLQQEPTTEKLIEWVMGREVNPDALYADRVEMQVSYQADRIGLPGLVSTLKDIN